MKTTVGLAGKNIDIEYQHHSTEAFLKAYACEEEADFTVAITNQDIAAEREKSRLQNIAEGKKVINYSDDYLETLAIYRKICEILPLYDVMLFHGSLLEYEDNGVLFTAESGTGKSTHARLWKKRFGDRVRMINDDKPLLEIGEKIKGYGTPWDGKHHLSLNESCSLKAIVSLERSNENWTREMSLEEAYPILISQMYRPEDLQAYLKSLELFEILLRNVKLYRLGCNMDISAAETSFKGVFSEIEMPE